MTSPAKKKAPAATGAIENRKSVNLENEGSTMNTSIADNSLESVAEMPLRDLQLQDWQNAIRDHLTASPLTFAQIAVRAEMPPTVLTRKLAQTECVFTIREIGNLSNAIGVDPDKIIRPITLRDTRPCKRTGCQADSHDYQPDGVQDDICSMKLIQTSDDSWAIGAFSEGEGKPWEAWANLECFAELSGQQGLDDLREAYAAYTKLQAYCDTLNTNEGLA